MLDKMPECDCELSGHGDDAHLAATRAILGKPRPIPGGELTHRLMPHPGPSDLDEQRSCWLVPGLTDPLIALDVAAGVRGWSEAEIRGEMPSARELSVEHLGDQKRRAQFADASQLGQHCDLG